MKPKSIFTPFWFKYSVLLSSQLQKGGTDYGLKEGFHLPSGTDSPNSSLPVPGEVMSEFALISKMAERILRFGQGHGSHLQGCPKEDRLERVLCPRMTP